MTNGERVALIGPNGCGKSTFLRTITAEVSESSGIVRFRGEDITDLETNQIVCRGIAYLRHTRNVFSGLTVAENPELAAMAGMPGTTRDSETVLDAFPILCRRETIRAGLLSGGERQALAMTMVLIRPASLLLLDELLAGLSQRIATELLDALARLQREDRFAVVAVEHRPKLIRRHDDAWSSRSEVASQKILTTPASSRTASGWRRTTCCDAIEPQPVLVITDGEALGDSLARLLETQLGGRVIVFSTLYSRCDFLLTAQRVAETNAFVLELLRRYPGGLRTEGEPLVEIS